MKRSIRSLQPTAHHYQRFLRGQGYHHRLGAIRLAGKHSVVSVIDHEGENGRPSKTF